MTEPSLEALPPLPGPRLALASRIVAVLALALLTGAIAAHFTGPSRAALGAAAGAALIAAVGWGPMVLRASGPSLAGAGGVGFLALAAAYVGAGLFAGVLGQGVLIVREILISVIFSFWVIAPMVVSLAVAIALATRLLAARRS